MYFLYLCALKKSSYIHAFEQNQTQDLEHQYEHKILQNPLFAANYVQINVDQRYSAVFRGIISFQGKVVRFTRQRMPLLISLVRFKNR